MNWNRHLDSEINKQNLQPAMDKSSQHEADVAQKDTDLWRLSRVRRLFVDLMESLRNPEFWALSAWLDIVVTYRRSRLGAVWLLMPSAVYIWMVGPLFGLLWGAGISKFVAHMALGWTVYTLMSHTITQSTHVLYGARSFIMDGRVRLTDFVLRCMAKATFHFLMSVPMVIIALVIYPEALHFTGIVVGLLGLVLVLINTFMVGAIFSIIGARLPDIHELIGNILRVIYFLTPILWYPAQMPTDTLRGFAARLNPFFQLIEVYRAPILGEPIGVDTWYYVGALTVVLMALAAFLYRRYARVVPVWL